MSIGRLSIEFREEIKLKKFLKVLITVIILCLAGFVYYYMALPAVNIHSPGFWWFIIAALSIAAIVLGFMTFYDKSGRFQIKASPRRMMFNIIACAAGIVIVIFIVGSIWSSSLINAGKYQKLLTVTERSYTDDIKEISYKDIPILDKDTAMLLGSRKMGSIAEYVSQFEVNENYTQINYQGVPVRVTPLRYGNLFKWLTNRAEGIPAYIKIDMTTQNVELVKLQEGMKYSEAEHFGRNIYRYLRFHYPTYIFDTINFEIDDEGTPYWICPVKDYTIGLFGGQTIGKVVTVNAITGALTEYSVEEVPTWIDKVFSAELLISLYDYNGTLKHGYWNSVFGQKDSLQTTDGYNYIALNDDVWVYTGVTSVGADESNVGFVLMNQRTSETRFYTVSGAEEYSAMASAEGQVQHLGYKATFPLLLNIGGEPTYFIALKDAAGLVKKYSMVNIEQYQIVAIGDTVNECEKTYLSLMNSNGINEKDTTKLTKITGPIKKISDSVVDGNTHYYILLNNSDGIFDVSVNELIKIVKYDIGDTITFSYTAGADVNTVIQIE
jgi:hypothetical protein